MLRSHCIQAQAAGQFTAAAEAVLLQASERTCNDGAESIEAKQEPSGSGQQDGSDSGSNQDAESVQARGGVSEDESDMEEGEIHGEHQSILYPNVMNHEAA